MQGSFFFSRVHSVIGGLIDDEQGGFRAGKGCVDQNQGSDVQGVYVGFIDLEKSYDRVNREALGQVL